MKNIRLIFLFIVVYSCVSSKHPQDNRSQSLVDVHRWGVRGDGIHDDRPAIQRAFQSGVPLFFPKGTYLLQSKTDAQSMLLITERGNPRRVKFAPGATLLVSPKQPTDYIKPAVIRVLVRKRDIAFLSFDGLTIEGNRRRHHIKNEGLVVEDQPDTRVKKLLLKHVTIENVGWNAIYSQAVDNAFYDIQTRNSGLHGIGFVNYNHRKVKGKVLIDGYTSTEDEGYSIDFSGPKDKEGNPYPGYAWEGTAKNIISKRSKYGIKTAGHWDLVLQKVTVEDSDHHGFFINVENTGHVIRAREMTFKNNKGTALNLRGYGRFEGRDIWIENCGKGMLDGLTDIDIQNLTVHAGPLSTLGIQIGGPVAKAVIDGFEISGFKPPVQYPVRLKGQSIELKNGVLKDNQSVFEMLVYPEAGDITLEHIRFEGAVHSGMQINGIRTLQKKGHLHIKDADFRALDGVSIQGARKHIRIDQCKGVSNLNVR